MKFSILQLLMCIWATAALQVENIKFGVSESKSISTVDLVPQYEENVLSGTVSAVSEFIHVQYDLPISFKPAYSSVVFSCNDDASISYVPSSKEENGIFKYRLVVNLAEDVQKFQHLTGKYSVSILVGDVSIQPSIKWSLGSLFLKFPPSVEQKLPLYSRSLLHASDTTLNALPEIEHVMRPPAVRAGTFAALAFSGLVILPLLVVSVYWCQAFQPHWKLRSVSSGALVLGWLSLLALYTGYWLAIEGFSFYSTIKYLCVLGPITLLLGRNTLGSI